MPLFILTHGYAFKSVFFNAVSVLMCKINVTFYNQVIKYVVFKDDAFTLIWQVKIMENC